jgi:hypothetical protein
MQAWLEFSIASPPPPYPLDPDFYIIDWVIDDGFFGTYASKANPNGWSVGTALYPTGGGKFAVDVWIPPDAAAMTYRLNALTMFDGFGGSGYSLFQPFFTVPVTYPPPPPGVGDPLCL